MEGRVLDFSECRTPSKENKFEVENIHHISPDSYKRWKNYYWKVSFAHILLLSFHNLVKLNYLFIISFSSIKPNNIYNILYHVHTQLHKATELNCLVWSSNLISYLIHFSSCSLFIYTSHCVQTSKSCHIQLFMYGYVQTKFEMC